MLQATAARRRLPVRIRRTPADFAVIFAGLLLLAALALIVGWQVWHIQRVYGGVTVAGVPVGGLTRSAALARVSESLARYPLPSISVTDGVRQWPITGDDLRVTANLLDAVNRAYLVGRAGDAGTQMGDQLAAALGAVDVLPTVTLETGQLRYTVDQIAAAVRRPARPAVQMGDALVPAAPGVDVDVAATMAQLNAALASGDLGQAAVVPLTLIELAPPAAASAEASVAASVAVSVATPVAPSPVAPSLGPLLLQDARTGLTFALDGATLADLVGGGDVMRLNEAKLREILAGWAAQVDVAPRDARLRFDTATQTPVVVQESRAGRKLDIDATVVTIRGALVGGQPRADLVMVAAPPAVDSSRVAEMGIRELVASGASYFAGSSGERLRNIAVAAEKFVGVAIPPNGIFSFNHYVEDISAANGFEDSLIIWGDRTAVGIGGGVCQVSTTIFRAAYAAGLPIVERYNHGYIVDWYGEPGLDATIFTPTVDFRFRNDTGAYLLMQPDLDTARGVLVINFYGTKPDRAVVISAPAQSDEQPAPPPLYTVDPSLAPGQTKQVDWAKPGMTVTVTRTITGGGETRTETLVSKYQPWRAVYLVGSEADIPASARATATPEAPAGEAAPVEEDAPSATPGNAP
jgi:vancomycin resistance protein YoaR